MQTKDGIAKSTLQLQERFLRELQKAGSDLKFERKSQNEQSDESTGLNFNVDTLVERSFLKNLRALELSFNKISALPLSVVQMTNLRNIKADDGTLRAPPPEIFKQGIKGIMGYLKELAGGSEKVYRCKLMMVGQENVGKTTLLHALRGITLKGNRSTDGISISEFTMRVKFHDESGKEHKENVQLCSWDFAGQEVYYSTHQLFLSARSIYILVFDLRRDESESRVEFWLQSIQSRAKEAPVIIVGSHLDDKKCTEEYVAAVLSNLERKYLERFPNIKCITVADTTKECKKFRAQLKEQIAQQQHMGEAVPRTYLEFEKLIIEEKSKGTIVHFEDKEFRDTVFLDPQFLTDLLSTIITTKHSFVKDGVLYHKDLSQIWREPTFPPNLHTTFLGILQRFEVGYQLINKTSNLVDGVDLEGRTLIPALLPDNHPVSLEEWWPSVVDSKLKHLERHYCFEFIPYGFLARLMIRMLHLAKYIHKYWRTGAVIATRREHVFLQLIPETNVLKVAVRAKVPESILRVIIETISNLIGNWYHIEACITLPCPECVTTKTAHPYMFTLEECTEAVSQSKAEVVCAHHQHVSKVEDVVPDVAMSDLGSIKIDYERDIQLEKELGRGAYGIIHKATWQKRKVAVKTFNAHSDVDQLERLNAFNEFRREVWLMSGIHHKCVVNFFGFSIKPFALVMELVEGGDLYTTLHDDNVSFSWEYKLKIAYNIACGMAFLHTLDPPLVHRDLKSPNILLCGWSDKEDVVAKIADFGASMPLFISAFKERSSERAVTQPTWLAPEIIAEDCYTEKSDIYAFGIILWEILTRKHPFQEFSFMSQLEDAVMEGHRPTIPDTCPAAYADLMCGCWDGSPEKRPPFKHCVRAIKKLAPEVVKGIVLARIPVRQVNKKEKGKLSSEMEQLKLQDGIARKEKKKKKAPSLPSSSFSDKSVSESNSMSESALEAEEEEQEVKHEFVSESKAEKEKERGRMAERRKREGDSFYLEDKTGST